jgi:hypothetical protein
VPSHTHIDIAAKDLSRAAALADALDSAAANEASDVDAARAIDLRNRVFWASDELAKEFREGGRYAFRGEPKVAAKFVSRYRVSQTRKSRRKKAEGGKAVSAAKTANPAKTTPVS